MGGQEEVIEDGAPDGYGRGEGVGHACGYDCDGEDMYKGEGGDFVWNGQETYVFLDGLSRR